MRPISRRRALQLGGTGLLAVAVGGTGLLTSSGSRLSTVTGARLIEPKTLRSADGGLQVRLEAAAGSWPVAGREATVYGYNGGVPGPTLRVRPGDRLQIHLVNNLQAPTNLHVHGLHVSPKGNGDNVFVTVEPGESFDYDYPLPDDHPPGVFWYHPHLHGTVADQVFGGLYGAIVVEDPDEIPVARERVLVVSDISLDAAGRLSQPSRMERMTGREGELLLVNGQHRPTLTCRPGERERWRVVNACTSRYLRLRLDGQRLDLLGMDAGRYPEPRRVDEVVLLPGNRADLMVTTTTEGSGVLQTQGVDRGGMGAMMGGPASGEVTALATLGVSGERAPTPAPMPRQPQPRDLRNAVVETRRRLTFGMGMGMGRGGMSFTIDGREFDPNRVDQAVKLGSVEEWSITNASPMDHPMHLHVWPMQIVAQRGRPVDHVRWQDVVNVPAGGEITVRISFDGFDGRTVYHCHILDHEDNGMMGVIEVR